MTITAMQELLDWKLFDNIVLNTALDKDILEATIVRTASTRSVCYTNANQFKFYSDMFFKQHRYTIDELVKTLHYDYNPIHNYDRTEEIDDRTEHTNTVDKVSVGNASTDRTIDETSNDTHSGNDKRVIDSDTVHGGSDSHKKVDDNTETSSGTDTIKDTGTNTVTEGGTTKLVKSENGNIHDTANNSEVTTNTISPFNNNNWVNHDKSDTETTIDDNKVTNGSETDTTTHGKSETTELGSNHATTYGKKIVSNGNETLTDTYGHNINENVSDTLSHGEVIDKKSNISDNATSNTKDTTTSSDEGNETYKHRAYAYGNIGVTTTQKMIAEQRDIVSFDIYQLIASMYCDELFCGVFNPT